MLRGTSGAGAASNNIWVPVDAPVVGRGNNRPALASFLAALAEQQERYPGADPRVHPFTGRVPLPTAAEEKERVLEAIDGDIVMVLARLEELKGSILAGVRSHWQCKLASLRAERDSLLAELDA